jgi:hypothetical protein
LVACLGPRDKGGFVKTWGYRGGTHTKGTC